MTRPVSWVLAVAAAVACGACADSPAQPSSPSSQSVKSSSGNGGSARGANAPPILALKTKPVADPTTLPYPTITGGVPLAVRFNLCVSDDPDLVTLPDGTRDPSGDTLNWQFHFGDSDQPAFNDDGTFNPDFDHFCRVTHVYEKPGRYLATLSVTDKHLQDQGRDVSAMSRVSTSVLIDVQDRPVDEAPPSLAPAILSFTVTRDGCDDAIFTWTTSNATQVTLDQGIGAFGPNGSTEANLGNGTVVTLSAVGPSGTATATATVPSSCE